jgi:hypothetical protein
MISSGATNARFGRRFVRNQLILCIVDLAVGPASEVLNEAVTGFYTITGLVVDRQINEFALCLGRGSIQRRLRLNFLGPNGLDDWLKDRQRNGSSCFTGAECAVAKILTRIASIRPDTFGQSGEVRIAL